MMDEKEAFNSNLKEIGKKYLVSRDYDSAVTCLTDYLDKVPNDTDVFNWLGQIFRDKNEFEKAGGYFRKALLFNEKDEVALYGLADVLREQGNYEESLRLTKEVLLINEDNGWAHHNLGHIFSLQQKHSQAEREYKIALRIMPDNISAYNGLVEVLAKEGKISECIQTFKKALEINENAVEIIKAICSYLLDKGRLGEAEELIQKFSIKDPNNLFLRKQLADIYTVQKEYTKAIKIYEQLIKANPHDTLLIRRLAEIYNNQREFDKAASLYERLLDKDPDNPRLIKNLADIYNNQKLFDKAAPLYEKLLVKEPDSPKLIKCLADLYNNQGLHKKAIVLYERLNDIVPNDINLLHTLAMIYKDLKEDRVVVTKYEKAANIYRKILDINPNNIKALIFLGDIYRYKKEENLAFSYYNKAIELDKSSHQAHFGMGKIFLENRQFSKAEEKFKEALKYNSNDVTSLHGLGDVYRVRNRYEEAKQFYNRCKEIDPFFTGSYLDLGGVFIRQRKFGEAINEFNKALEIGPSREEEVINIKKELNWAIREKERYELACLSCNESSGISKERVEEIIRPRFCALGIVQRCNFKCKMCHIWENKDKEELSMQQWKNFFSSFRRVADDHCQINFAGGEPFLKKGLTELIRFVHDEGFITAVCTNAYFIDEKMAREIGNSRLDTIALSLDSLDEKRHDFLRGVKGSYKKVMSAIELLRKYAPKTELNLLTIILQLNLEGLIPLVKWAQSNEKINMISFLALIQPRGNERDRQWHDRPESKMLWPQDRKRLNDVIDSLIDMKNTGPKVGNPVSQLLKFKKYYENPDEFISRHIKCNMGYIFLSVNEKGYVSLCEERDPIWNILEQDIYDIWFSKRADEERVQLRNCNRNCHQLINCCYEEEIHR